MKHPERDDRYATAADLGNLVREVDELRRTVGAVATSAGRIKDLAARVAGLAETVHDLQTRPGVTPPPSWLNAPTDTGWVSEQLDELAGWMQTIYLRYTDAAQSLPDCWCFHADVVEELLWLMHAWLAAFQGSKASVQLVGDWHDRLRPGVVRRIRATAGTCSPEAHLVREGWRQVVTGAPPLPAENDLTTVATWWADDRDSQAPEPLGARAYAFGSALDGTRNDER